MWLHTTIVDLHAQVAEFQSKTAKNSTNSSLPLTSVHTHAKPARPTPKSVRGVGAQLPQQAVLYIDESPTKAGKTKSWIRRIHRCLSTCFFPGKSSSGLGRMDTR